MQYIHRPKGRKMPALPGTGTKPPRWPFLPRTNRPSKPPMLLPNKPQPMVPGKPVRQPRLGASIARRLKGR